MVWGVAVLRMPRCPDDIKDAGRLVNFYDVFHASLHQTCLFLLLNNSAPTICLAKIFFIFRASVQISEMFASNYCVAFQLISNYNIP